MNPEIRLITNIILDNSSDPIFAFTREGRYLYVNNAFAGPCLKTPDEIIGRKIWDIFPGEQGDHRFKAVKQAFETGETVVLEVKVENEKVRNFYITTVKPVKKEDGSIDVVICISKDITERKLTEEKLDQLVKELYSKSISDGLTGIYNRTHAIGLLENEMKRASEFNSRLSVIMLDIDLFKHVNDIHGHLIGDDVIVEMAKLFESFSTETGFVGRYGGEEFMLVIPGYNEDWVLQKCEILRKSVENTLFSGNKINITVSMGVAFYNGQCIDDFIKAADIKLYEAKENGRNRIEC